MGKEMVGKVFDFFASTEMYHYIFLLVESYCYLLSVAVPPEIVPL